MTQGQLIERAKEWVRDYCVEPHVWPHCSNVHTLCYVIKDLLTIVAAHTGTCSCASMDPGGDCPYCQMMQQEIE